MGKLKVHVHDVPNQTLLIGICESFQETGSCREFFLELRFCTNMLIPKAVVSLEVASNGHCMIPLRRDLLASATLRKQPFSRLADG